MDLCHTKTMKTNTNISFSPVRGIAPLIIILAIVVLGGGVFAVVNRNILKTYFETGDVPTQEQFSDTIDSSVHMQDDGIKTGAKTYDPAKTYTAGDTTVHSGLIYQAKVLGEVQPVFKLDSAQTVTFRWTPVVPKPKEPVTYRLKVWQLMQGQSGTSAMRENKPIVTKDVDNVTETTVSGIYTGPCRPPYLCDFVWSAEAVTAASPAGTATGATTGASTAADASASTGTSGY
jgi:hypothetical protein